MEETEFLQEPPKNTIHTPEVVESNGSLPEVQQAPSETVSSSPKKRPRNTILLFILFFVLLSGTGSLFLINSKRAMVVEPQEKSSVEETQDESADHTVSSAQPEGGEEVVAANISAMKRGDWATVYDLTSSTFTSGITKEEYVASFSSQEAELGKVVDAEVLTNPDYQTSPLGIPFFTVQTRVTFENDGILEVDDFTDTYVFEDGQWKFWFSVEE